MIFKRAISAMIALAMTTGLVGAVPVTAETGGSDNGVMSTSGDNLSINETNNTKGDVNSDGKITDDDIDLLDQWLVRRLGDNDIVLDNADINMDGKVNILDLVELNKLCDTVKKTTSKQSIDEGSEAFSAINTEDNAFKLSVDISAAGDAQTLLSADESGYSNAIKSDMVVGVVPELEYEEGYAVEEVTLNFDIKDDVTINNDGKYASVSDDFKGVRKFNVFKYFEDIDMLLPIETNYDTESNTVTTTVDELGTYCLVDMEKWFETLGIKPEELANANTAPSSVSMVGTSKITTDKNPLIYSTSSDIELSNVSNKKIDIVLNLFLRSNSSVEVSNQAKILGNSIFNSCDDSCSVNIYVVDYRGKPLAVPGTGKAYAENTDEFNAIFENGITKRATSTKPSLENFVTNFLENYSLRKDARKYYIAVESDEVTAKNLDGIKTRLSNEDILPFLVTNINMEDHASLVGSPDAYCDKIVAYSRPAYEFIIGYLNKNTYIIPTGWKQISLEKPITNEYKTFLDDYTQADKYDFTDRERFPDTDEDGLIDLREIRYSFNGEDVITWDSDGKVILPTIKDCLKLKSGKKYLENVLSQYKFVDWDDFDRFNNIRILPINSDPTSEDSDKDGVNEEDDALPFHYNDSVSYIFVPDDVDEDETLKYVLRGYKYKLCNETKDIVKVVICKNTQDFENYWNNMDLTQEGKIIYKINQVHLLGHGAPHCLDISGRGSLHGSLFDDDFSLDNGDISIGGLQLKEIELLNTIGCNCGNLDFNSDNNGDGFYGDNLAISFLKNDYKIKKVTAWDGYAYIYGETIFSQISDAYCAKMIDDMKSTAFNSKKTEESDFQKWSKDVNGFKRESEGLITYYRADDGSIIANPSEKHYID